MQASKRGFLAECDRSAARSRRLTAPATVVLRGKLMPPDAYTLPQLSKLLDVQYRTLHSWVERGLIQPSVQQSSGTGTRNLFDERDALTACVLAELRAAGVNFDLLQQASERLRNSEDAVRRQAFMLFNGDVKIVFDEQEAAATLKRGGLTLAYNTAAALERLEQIGT
jgi:DNA-binding transcriptional MerR regulator